MRIYFTSSDIYSNHGLEHESGSDLEVVSDVDLRWYYFLGVLGISHSGVEIGPPWGWTPLFDAMYSVRKVMIFTQGGPGLGKIDFTENDESIEFVLNQDNLRIMPTYMESELRCTVDEFTSAGVEFIRLELKRVTAQYPALVRNSHVHALAVDVGIDLAQE